MSPSATASIGRGNVDSPSGNQARRLRFYVRLLFGIDRKGGITISKRAPALSPPSP
jgi:hypothetical protein